MATAAIAMGDVQIAARDGRLVPPGTGLDENGESTTDLAEIIKGVLLPFGGHKGSHMAMMIELLAGPLVGETASFASKERNNGDGSPPQGGQFILAMNPKILSQAVSGKTKRSIYQTPGPTGWGASTSRAPLPEPV